MRYIYYIILIFLVLSGAMAYELLSPAVPAKDTAMVINGQVITREEFNSLCSSPSNGMNARSDAINFLITRELLIQEAQREGIDKEESFRRSMQNFYEQSLIKLLMDKKFNSLRVAVSDSELDRYISLMGRKVRLTVFTADTLEDAGKGDYKGTETREMNFDDLSRDMRERIVPLKEGEKTEPVKEGGKFIVLRLDKVGDFLHKPPSAKERDNVREMLAGEKRERMISDWIAGLRKRASVKVMLNRKD
jgi:hypothetical protein